MNIVCIVGRMVYEPELKTSKNGNSYLPVRIAVPRNDKDKNTDFISGRAWGKTGEFLAKYFHKGDPIAITGSLRSENYEKADGTKVNEMVVVISEANFVPKSYGQTDQKPEALDKESDVPFEL